MGSMGEDIADDDELAREIMQVEADDEDDDDENYDEDDGEDGMVDGGFDGDQVEVVEGSDGLIDQDGEELDMSGEEIDEDDVGEEYGDE